MTRARAWIVLAAALAAGCACGHARDARLLREGVELVAQAASTAQVRSLTPAELDAMSGAVYQVRRHAAALEDDAR